jgi:hypothetical protein
MKQLLVKVVELPAVALFANIIPWRSEGKPITKFCVVPELFVMPTPLIVSVNPGLAVMVYGFVAAEVKMMPLTSVCSDIETLVVFERPKVAVSAGPLGTSIGVQLAAVFQSPEMGSRSHWALIPYVTAGMRNTREQRIAVRISVFIVISLGLASMREITKRTGPRLALWNA